MIYQALSAALTPITAQPFQNGYREYAPCPPLKPYIRCFWTAQAACGRLVIPDLCADIIFESERPTAFFSGISDQPFNSSNSGIYFGIRFYSWTAALFSEETLKNTLNGGFELGAYFPKLEKQLANRIRETKSTAEKIALAENFLLSSLHYRQNRLLTEALGEIIAERGVCTADSIARNIHISRRQLERVFSEYSGLSPKKTAMLVRYQYIWRDILFGKSFDAKEKALEYGYTDQSHLLNDFRRFHTLTPANARKIAIKDVAFLQDTFREK